MSGRNSGFYRSDRMTTTPPTDLGRAKFFGKENSSSGSVNSGNWPKRDLGYGDAGRVMKKKSQKNHGYSSIGSSGKSSDKYHARKSKITWKSLF